MNDIRKYITILENASQDELQKYRDEVKYWQNEHKKYCPISKKLMAQYKDGTNTTKTSFGTLLWQNQNNQPHRDGDKPAVINEYGTLYWYQNGKMHRDGDKPAAIYADSTLEWWQNSKCHRDGDKPAVIGADGTLGWWQNNQRHRFGGPAVIYPSGKREWWWRGEHIPVKSQEEFIEYLKKHKGLQRFRVNKP